MVTRAARVRARWRLRCCSALVPAERAPLHTRERQARTDRLVTQQRAVQQWLGHGRLCGSCEGRTRRQEQPELIPMLLQQLSQSQPEIAQLIQAHPQEFMALLSGGGGAAG